MARNKVYNYEPVFKKTTLTNGVRIVTESHPGFRSTSVGLFVDLGTRDESKNMIGATHFVEHMVFKGTAKRTGLEISESLEMVGGDLNAFTTREMTCFHAHCLNEDVGLAIDVLCDLVTSANFSEEDFEKERQVIVQEIDMSKDDVEEYIIDTFCEKYFAKHPLSRWITGTEKSLMKITRDQLYKFYKSEYCGSRITLSVAGPIDHDNIVRLSSELLSQLPKGEPADRSFKQKIKPVHLFEKRSSEQIHLLYAVPSSTFTSPHRFEAYVFNAILGGGMTSRLYQKVREHGGLVYSIYSFLQTFVEKGVLFIYAGASQDNYKQVEQIVLSELELMIKEGPTEKEIEDFKRQLKGQILLGADDMENRMNSLGVNEIVFSNYRPVEQVIAEIDAVSLKTMKEYIQAYLKGTKPSRLIMGDLPRVPKGFERIQ